MKKRYPFSAKNGLHSSLFLLLAAFFSVNLQAQTVPVKLWDRTLGGNSGDYLFSLKQTSDGGYILGGWSVSGISGDKTQPNQGDYDYWVVKLDASGNKLWDKTFGGSENDWLQSVQQTSDGGYILGGHSENRNCNDCDYWIIKLDASGNKLWDKSIGGDFEDHQCFIQQTTDGGYILGGSSNSGISCDKTQAPKGGQWDTDYWVIKVDANGNKLWDKTFGGSNTDALGALQQTSDGGYILGGWSQSPISGDKTQANKGDYDYWVVKVDASGNKLWDKTFGGNNVDGLNSIHQTFDGGYILGGNSLSGISGDKTQPNQGDYDYWVVKLDSSGNKLWDKSIGGNLSDGLRSIQQTTDGGYILDGSSNSGISGDKTQASQGGDDYWVVKLNSSGNKIWDKTLGGSSHDRLNCLVQTSDGGYILGGWSLSGNSGDKTQANKGDYDYWVVKLGAQAPYLPTDIAVSAITSANSGCLTSQETITITVNNFGTTTQSNIPISYKINNGTPVNEVLAGPLTSNTSVNYSFITKANLNITGTATIEAKANLYGDAQPTNDTFTKVITAYAVPPAPGINVISPLAICPGDSVALIAVSAVPRATFTWFKDGNVIAGAASATYMAKTAGNYTATATSNGCPSPASLTRTVIITPVPTTPVLTQTGYVLTSSSTSGNQWYKDNVAISGATSQTYTATSNGSYTVVVTNNGCPSEVSNAIIISTTGIGTEVNALNVGVHPNPSNGLFTIILPEGECYKLTVTDLTGKVIRQLTTKDKLTQLNISDAAKGVYLLKIISEGKTAVRKLIVE